MKENLKIFGSLQTNVYISPLRAIEVLVENAMPNDSFIREEEDGTFNVYYTYSVGHGDTTELLRPSTKEEFEYVEALTTAKQYISKKYDEEIMLQREFEKFKKQKNDSH